MPRYLPQRRPPRRASFREIAPVRISPTGPRPWEIADRWVRERSRRGSGGADTDLPVRWSLREGPRLLVPFAHLTRSARPHLGVDDQRGAVRDVLTCCFEPIWVAMHRMVRSVGSLGLVGVLVLGGVTSAAHARDLTGGSGYLSCAGNKRVSVSVYMERPGLVTWFAGTARKSTQTVNTYGVYTYNAQQTSWRVATTDGAFATISDNCVGGNR